MLRANQYWFYDLGAKIHPLTQLQQDAAIVDVFWPLWEARKDLDATYMQFPLRVSKNAGIALFQAITAVLPVDFNEALKLHSSDTKIDFRQAYGIRQAASNFETVLAAELQVMDSYLVSQKGTYSTPDLIDNGELMIPQSLRVDLPAQSVIDLKAAGRCLAFNVPTATAFHVLRSAESVLRMYYQEVTGKLPKAKMRNWGAYVKNLNAVGANPKITGLIDHLRDLYRNPVLHAEDNVSIEEAIVFIGACVSLICKVVLETQELRLRRMSQSSLAVQEQPPQEDTLPQAGDALPIPESEPTISG